MPAKHNSQFYIFNLFGNFIEPRQRSVWTTELIQLMRVLGVEEKTTRSTLARMREKGWLTVAKEGRQSRYALSQDGLALLAEGDERIFEMPAATWDGCWHLVTYSLPESEAQKRNSFAKRLRWVGYGNLSRGTWISPTDRSKWVWPIVEELKIVDFVEIFSGAKRHGADEDRVLIERCWDLGAVETEYRQFMAECEPLFALDLTEDELGSAEEAFRRFFWLSQTFQAFPRIDPNLPLPLLPDGWIGHDARRLFYQYRQRLKEELKPFLDEVLAHAP